MKASEISEEPLVSIPVPYLRIISKLGVSFNLGCVNAMDDLLLAIRKLDGVEYRTVTKIDRDFLKELAEERGLEKIKLADKDARYLPVMTEKKHLEKLTEFSKNSGEPVSYFYKVALEDFLISLDLLEAEPSDKEELRSKITPSIPSNPQADTATKVSISDLEDL